MEQKILQYESEFGKEEIMLQVRPYGSEKQTLYWNGKAGRGRGVIW